MNKTLITFFIVLFCLTSSVGWSETLSLKDLVKRDGTYYQKFQNNPFTGKIETSEDGMFYKEYFKDGKRDGKYEVYDNRDGTMVLLGSYKQGKKDGVWLNYKTNGDVLTNRSYVDGKLVKCKSVYKSNCKGLQK